MALADSDDDERDYFRSSSTGHEALQLRLRRRASIERGGRRRFSIVSSTEEFNKDEHDFAFYGPYAHIREALDYGYHAHYKKERQWLQDSIIEDCLDTSLAPGICVTPTEQWLLYTVGAKGAGKQYTVSQLVQDGRLPLLSYVLVDTDYISRRLPEYESYLEKCPECVGELTHKEAGYIAEILARAALQAGRNVVWDTALHDAKYYAKFTKEMKGQSLKVGMLHVTAPREVILDRVARQASVTERYISEEITDHVLAEIPKSISLVAPLVDYYCTISNHTELCILTNGETWDSFRTNFAQTCAWQPGQRALMKVALHDDDEKKESTEAVLRASRKGHRRHFSALLSSEENHRADKLEFFGPYSHIRKTLDYTYHAPYTRERQTLQDAIISDLLATAVIKDKNGDVCTTPTEPWIVFTAGSMGAGKSWTLKRLVEEGRFPLLAFVTVDPDEIRRHLPEFHLYIDSESPELAGELTRKEAGFIAEILTMVGLQAGKNVLVDGSLRDFEWYKGYFERLRENYKNLKIAIIHVTAPREAVFQRAAERALTTGRVVPKETLMHALEQVPKSVAILGPLADYYCTLHNAPNAPDIEVMTEGETWESFEQKWLQTCAWVPSRQKLRRDSKNVNDKLALGGTLIN